MAEVGSAFVSILPSARGFGSKLNSEVGGEIDGAGKSMGSRFGSAFKVGALALLAGGVLAGKFLSGAIGEAREAAVVTARTENVIKSMGLTSKVSAGQIADLATAISNKTGVDDEAIQSGQNLLLTFKNVANDAGKAGGVFDQTSRLMVDMSAAMGTDAKGAAIQLGKALNDPTKGLSALSRVGVSFSAQQADQIKKYQESGQLAKAQGIILGELKNQIGGAAAAMATPADKLKVSYGNLKEQIGTALLPVVDRFLNLLLSAMPAVSSAIAGIGPAFGRVKEFLAPFIAQVQGFFGGGGAGGSALSSFAAVIQSTVLPALQQFGAFFTSSILPVVMQFIAAIQANFLPVLQTMSATFTGTVLPAITSLASYLASTLFPVFQQVAAIITGQVIPIIASFAQFLYGTLYPAVIGIYVAVASKLKPVFDQLVATFRGSVLPAIQQLLVKFREWQPTIQKVIAVMVQIIGKVLEFAAAVLAKVLPVAIRFAGFLLSNLVPAVVGVIGTIVKVIAKVIEFGQTVVDAVKFVAKFVSGLKDKFGEALDYVQSIPGKIGDALSGLYDIGKHAVEELIRGLVNALTAGISKVKDKVSEIAGAVKGFFPGSPVKEGPLTVWNDGRPGRYLMEMLARGIEQGKPAVITAAMDAAKTLRDTFKTRLDQIKSDFASLSSSVASAFTGNLFEAETAGDFIANLLDTKGQLKDLKQAFRKLQRWGFKPAFLSQLFQSGNAGLILDLASGSRADAMQGASLFSDVQSLSASLGNAVARDKYGDELRKQTNRLERVEKAIKHVGDDVARALNHMAAQAQRSAT